MICRTGPHCMTRPDGCGRLKFNFKTILVMGPWTYADEMAECNSKTLNKCLILDVAISRNQSG